MKRELFIKKLLKNGITPIFGFNSHYCIGYTTNGINPTLFEKVFLSTITFTEFNLIKK